MSEATRERELKFDVPDGWTTPDVAGLLPKGGTLSDTVLSLESTYYDTDDRLLFESGVTLRRRTGGLEDTGWQLKIPAGAARVEIRVPLGGSGVPAELRRLTVGLRGRPALKPVATIRTERTVRRLLAADGTPLVEFADDAVVSHVQREFAVTRSWHEVEIELLDGGEKLLGRAALLLTGHGATPASSGSKLARALDASGLEPRETESLSGAVGSYLDEQFAALVHGDVQLRRGADVVHATRVATRRYRSVLRVFGDLFETDRATRLDAELKWFAEALGHVRDRQVLRGHLTEALEALPAELIVGDTRAEVAAALDEQEELAQADLAAVMGGKRYAALVVELRAWRHAMPVVADGSAADVDNYVRHAERTLRKRLKKAHRAASRDEVGSDVLHHRARKAAKRARYIGELATPVLGKRAAKQAKQAKTIQTRLGDRQDNVMAAEFLLELATAGTTTNQFTLGLLYARERAHGDAID